MHSRAWQTPGTFDDQELSQLKAVLERLGRDQPADQPLIVYLRAYALPTKDGDLAVLPGDARWTMKPRGCRSAKCCG